MFVLSGRGIFYVIGTWIMFLVCFRETDMFEIFVTRMSSVLCKVNVECAIR